MTRQKKPIKKPRTSRLWIGAKLVDAYGTFMRYFKAPVSVDGPVPELFTVVRLRGGEAAALLKTNPVTYRWVGKAPIAGEKD